ncbi:MAG TPA: response regulator, partial [Acidobacteriota bacterium]|nr:response regulator [Acidobacteriota bacterium]
MSSWDDTLKDLREQYVRGSSDRLSNIDRTLETLENQPADENALRDLRRYFHGLGGSGKTYGFAQVTEIGLWGEQECDGLLREKVHPTLEHLNRWRGFLDELKKEFQKGSFDDSALSKRDDLPKTVQHPFQILIVDDDEDVCRALSTLLQEEGMIVHVTHTKAEAQDFVDEKMPDGIIVDVILGDASGYELVEYVRNLPDGDGPSILMISALTGFHDKVESISCGSDGFFEKPVQWEVLIQRLRYLLSRERSDPPRILSVEDDEDQAAFLRAVLQSAGYQVRICNDPRLFEAHLISFRPDLVIMDIILPDITGIDLARYLRQNEQYTTLPVLFLSMQGQMQDRIETVRAGGDDHLVKPVAPGLLLSTVAARIERSRFLKSLLDRDGLTKLLTHTAFLERARAIVGQKSRRIHKNSVLVLMDLDHFKSVNDTYGHIVGDRVLVSLASLLRRRLRQTDTIGRYGGEEFGILIDDLKKDEAVRLINRLLDEFSAIEHQTADNKTFQVTFSAGIAVLKRRMTLP